MFIADGAPFLDVDDLSRRKLPAAASVRKQARSFTSAYHQDRYQGQISPLPLYRVDMQVQDPVMAVEISQVHRVHHWFPAASRPEAIGRHDRVFDMLSTR